MKAKICKKYDVEYGSEIIMDDYESFVNTLKKIDNDLIIAEDPYNFLEIDVNVLMIKDMISKNKDESKFLDNILEAVKDNYDYFKKKGFVRMEWI